MNDVTVITLTRQRLNLVRRAIDSVRAQDYCGNIVHLILIDDCIETRDALAAVCGSATRRVMQHHVSRESYAASNTPHGINTVYPRIARLLNVGVRLATTRWIAFLDDDNEYETNHLSSLFGCAVRFSSPAVHSFRRILNHDGSPYLEQRFPWTRDPSEAARIFTLLCSRGVWVRHSNVLKDRAGPSGLAPFKNSTILSSRDPVFMVDTSVWLFDRELLLRYPVPEEFSAQDIADETAPDDKLLEVLLRARVPIVASGLPTLRYYLGGISN